MRIHDLSASLLLTVLESSCSSEDTTAPGNVPFLGERSDRKELSCMKGELKKSQQGVDWLAVVFWAFTGRKQDDHSCSCQTLYDQFWQ